MPDIVELAPAKVNLTLSITGRRPDGYHLLDSLFVYVDLYDRLVIKPHPTLRLTVEGAFATALDDDNLVVRAARVLQAKGAQSAGASIHLWKDIPVAAGLGGGSADAAAALRGLNKLWRMGLSLAELADIGAAIGADVPAAVYSQTTRVRGIGEQLDLGPASAAQTAARHPIVLVNPGVGVATQQVFQRWRQSGIAFGVAEDRLYSGSDHRLSQKISIYSNMLSIPAQELCPAIGDVLQALSAEPGCDLSRMSGSGATCFGLFSSTESATRAAAQLRDKYGWWTWAGKIRDSKL